MVHPRSMRRAFDRCRRSGNERRSRGSPAVPRRGLLPLFQHHGLLPRTLKFLAALGDVDAVRGALAESPHDLATVNEAFVRACSFRHEDIASVLLERSIALDPELGKQVDESPGRRAFIEYFIEHRPSHAIDAGPWKAFVIERITRTIHDDDPAAFVGQLQRAPWLLGDNWVDFQSRLIELDATVCKPRDVKNWPAERRPSAIICSAEDNIVVPQRGHAVMDPSSCQI